MGAWGEAEERWYAEHGEIPLLLLGHTDGRRYWCVDERTPGAVSVTPVWAMDEAGERARCCMCARPLRYARALGERNQATVAAISRNEAP